MTILCKIYFVFFIFVVCANHENIFTTKIYGMSSGAHGRDALTESRHSVEEESAPAVKRKCIRDEDIMTQG